MQQSALHRASAEGLAGTVAKLLALGANAALTDKVRACTYMNTWEYTNICVYISWACMSWIFYIYSMCTFSFSVCMSSQRL